MLMQSPPSPASIEQPYGWVVAYAALVIMGIAFGTPYVTVVALKLIAAEFGSPLAEASLCYGLTLLGAGLGGIVIGRWADKHGIFRPALIACCAIPIGAMLLSRANSMVELWLIHLFIVGFLGNGALLAPLLAYSSRWFDRRRGVAIALVGSGQSLAGMLWPSVFEVGIANIGWRGTLVWFAAAAACLMLPLTFVFRRPPPVPPADIVRSMMPGARVWGWPANVSMAGLCVAIFGCCTAMSMPLAHTVAFCTDLGFSAANGARMLSLLLLAAFLSRLIWGTLADRIGGLMTILISSSCQALALSLYAVVDSLAGLYVLSMVYGLAFGGIIPTYAVVVREFFPASEAGWRIGTVLFCGTIGMAAGAWLAGAVRDTTGFYQAAFLVGVSANVLNLAMIGALRLRAGPKRMAFA